MADRHVVVVGGGITGLSAAFELRRAADPPAVTVLEASDRLGGKILTTPFAGLSAVDAGPDFEWADFKTTGALAGAENVAHAVAAITFRLLPLVRIVGSPDLDFRRISHRFKSSHQRRIDPVQLFLS